MSEPNLPRAYFPETDADLADLRERVRERHVAYLRKWADWQPDSKTARNPVVQ